MKLLSFIFILLISLLLRWPMSLTKSVLKDVDHLLLKFSTNPHFIQLELLRDEQIYTVNERVKNGDFTQALANWQTKGQVQYLAEEQAAQLGQADSSNLWEDNCLSQTIKINNATPAYLYFEYQTFTQETLPLFDQTSFVVLLNEQIRYVVAAKNNLGWQQGWINLTNLEAEDIDLKFCAGNSLDHQQSSWVWLRKVSTQSLAPNQTDQLKISWQPAEADMTIDDDEISQNPYTISDFTQFSEQINFSLTIDTQQINKDLILANNLTPDFTLFNFKVTQEADETYTLQFNSDIDLQNLPSTVYYADNYFFINDLTNIDKKEIFYDPEHPWLINQDQYLLNLELPEAQYWLLSVQKLNGEKVFSQIYPHVLVNEVMFNPEGSDTSAEWFELFNPGPTVISIDNWKLLDAADNEIIITPAQPNLQPGEFLQIINQNNPIFNNSGDTLFLFDSQNQVVDQLTYTSATGEGLTFCRFPDGKEWQADCLASPNSANQITP